METKQKEIANKLKISEPYLSLILSKNKPVSWAIADKLSKIFPKKDIKYWKKATPEQIKKAFHQIFRKKKAAA